MSISPNDPLYKHVIEFIHRVWGSKDYFPGPQPISIEYRHFDTLRQNDYVVCEKTDGTRMMLVATMFECEKVCLFVNRAFEMFRVPLNLRRPAYNGTILDAEFYEDTLMVYDAVIIDGVSFMKQNFVERLDAMEKFLKKIIYVKSDRYRLKLKKFHHMSDFAEFMDVYLPTVEQKVDGLVFTPAHEPIRIGTHETMFKWKPRELNTVDFLMKKERDWRLYVQEKGQLVYESTIPFNRMIEPDWFEDGAIVECEYITNEAPMWWRPIKRRYDKTYPNNRRTFYRTIVNIKENIKMKDFLDCIPECSVRL